MQPIDYVAEHQDRFLSQLFDYLRIPSISTDAEYKGRVAECADWLAKHLRDLGIEDVSIEQTDGHPIVYAERIVDPSAPTYLLYGHYDVQPPDPLELWDTPPFEPTVRDEKIFARGATDDKGQLFCHLKAIEAHLACNGKLPVNVKLLIEGEEEVGSEHLEPWITENRDRLACDAVIVSDSSMYGKGIPSIMYALRGLAYFEIKVTGPSHDLHSGLFGGAVPNPINVLTQIIGQLHHEDGRIAIDGFYDDVRPLEDDERQAFAGLPFSEEAFLRETGAKATRGEAGYSILEQTTARPTLDCNGIWGGFTGDGAKTVLPSEASAKFSCRLVPNQTPEKIGELVRAHIERIAPADVKVEVRSLHGGSPVITERDTPSVQAAMRAFEKCWGKEPVFVRGGGSIPVVATFAEVLGAPTVLMGFGYDDDRLHSPNEKFDLACFEAGIRTSTYLWDELARA
jgi:acetylornithine deacetylase/succinyl-diaminopimelate desuccinylase-like protein